MALKSIVEFPFKVSFFFESIAHSIEAHQVLVRQPEHCTIVRCLLMTWPSQLTEDDLAQPTVELEEKDVTARFQTFWSLFDNLQQLSCSAAQLLERLNLQVPEEKSWMLLVTFRAERSANVFLLPVSGSAAAVKFPPFQPGKRIIRPPQSIRGFEACLPTGERQPVSSPLLAQLLGPKQDLWASAPSGSAPNWLLLRLVRRQIPSALSLALVRS